MCAPSPGSGLGFEDASGNPSGAGGELGEAIDKLKAARARLDAALLDTHIRRRARSEAENATAQEQCDACQRELELCSGHVRALGGNPEAVLANNDASLFPGADVDRFVDKADQYPNWWRRPSAVSAGALAAAAVGAGATELGLCLDNAKRHAQEAQSICYGAIAQAAQQLVATCRPVVLGSGGVAAGTRLTTFAEMFGGEHGVSRVAAAPAGGILVGRT